MRLRADELTDALSRVADRSGPQSAPDPGGLEDVRRRAQRQTRERRRRTGLAVAAVVLVVGALGGSMAWRSTRHEQIGVPADDPTTTTIEERPIYSRNLSDGTITARVTLPVAQPVQWGPYSDSGWYRKALTCGPDQLTVRVQRSGRPELTGTIEWPMRRLLGPTAFNDVLIPAEPMQPIGFSASGIDPVIGGASTWGFISTGRPDGELLRATFSDGSTDETPVSSGVAVFVGATERTDSSGLHVDPWDTDIDVIAADGTATRVFAGFGGMADGLMTDPVPSGPCPEPAMLPATSGPADAVAQSNAITDTVRRTFGPGAGPDAMSAGVLDASAELSAAFERVTTKLPGHTDIPTGETEVVIHEVRFVGADTAWVRFGRILPSLPDVEMPGVGGWVQLVHTPDGWRITRDSICGIGGWNGEANDVCRPPDDVPNG